MLDYKNLGERYILSTKVHMDEETHHMHFVFMPVVNSGKEDIIKENYNKKRRISRGIFLTNKWKNKCRYK